MTRIRPLFVPVLIAGALAMAPMAVCAANGGRPLPGLEQALSSHTGGDSAAIRQFYSTYGYHSIWDVRRAQLLLDRLNRASEEGLSRTGYPIERLEKLLDAGDGRFAAEREMLFSETYVRYARELGSGRIEPAKADPQWHIRHLVPDAAGLLVRVSKATDFDRLLDELPPQTDGYAKLRMALAHYRSLAKNGGWPTDVPEVSKELPRLEPGVTDPRIPVIRDRLRASGEFEGAIPEQPEFYDDALKDAVIRFQRRHGLEADGVVGGRTRLAMNTSVEERIRQIVLAMERMRWLPRDASERGVRVNVPGFELEVVDQGRTVLGMKVIAGRPTRATPSFQASMSHLVFNPYWSIPARILREDVLPAMQKDPEYLSRKNIRILAGSGEETRELSPEEVDWDEVNSNGFPYRMRRDPGEDNDLGRVKFLLPNSFDIYLHDTPSRKLFGKAHRAFSSGCIRLERPLDLAVLALGWERERIEEAIGTGKTREVRLPRAIPVYIYYQTAWVDAEGIMQFRDDLYRRDRSVWRALSAL